MCAFSLAVTNSMIKGAKQLEGEEFIWLNDSQSVREAKTETQGGTQGRILEECCLQTYFLALSQTQVI